VKAGFLAASAKEAIFIDVSEKKITLLIVSQTLIGLTAEFSDTPLEKRGTQVFGANPHCS